MSEAAAITQPSTSAPSQPAVAPPTPAPTGQNAPSGQETPRAPGTASPEKTEPAAKPELFEIKANGKTQRLTREELIRQAQLGYSATERFEQAAAEGKRINAILAKAKTHPIEHLMEAGLTEDEAREAFESWYSRKYIEPESLTPDQRKARALEDELKRYKQAEKDWQEKQRESQLQAETSAHREVIQKKIIEAMDANGLGKLSKAAKTFAISRIAFYMKKAAEQGYEAPMDLIAQQVKEEQAYFRQDPPDGADWTGLIEMYSEPFAMYFVKAHLSHIRTLRGKPEPTPVAQAEGTNTSGGRISMRDADIKLKRMMGRR